MARQLNPKSREKIISNAISIMHKDGYTELSMRKVALKSNMVVGNVYRYFPSKDDLIHAIFNPVFLQLDYFLSIPFEELKNQHPNPKEFRSFIMNQSSLIAQNIEQLLAIYFKELHIIFKDDQLSRKINQKVSSFLQKLIRYYFPISETLDEKSSELIKMFSRSISAGIIECIMNYPLNKDIIKELIQNYLSIYSKLLEIEL